MEEQRLPGVREGTPRTSSRHIDKTGRVIPHAALDRPCKSGTQLVVLKLISSIVLGDGEGVVKGEFGDDSSLLGRWSSLPKGAKRALSRALTGRIYKLWSESGHENAYQPSSHIAISSDPAWVKYRLTQGVKRS